MMSVSFYFAYVTYGMELPLYPVVMVYNIHYSVDNNTLLAR
jgi:hypothetical protein